MRFTKPGTVHACRAHVRRIAAGYRSLPTFVPRHAAYAVAMDIASSSPIEAAVCARLSEQARENVFAPYRERILYPVAGTLTVALLPLAVHHLLRGRFDVGGLLLLLV